MIQVNGLTKVYRRGRPPALLDLGFDVRPGTVLALLGPEDAGKTTALRLMLELDRGQGVALFNGRTYRRLRRPEREVGVLLPASDRAHGCPGRTARGHLRMLAAAVGAPANRADELLEQMRLATVAEHRLRSFSLGMSRRLALAAALLGDPDTLLLDAPTEGLSSRNVEWLHAFLRAFPTGGGTVVVTTRSLQEAALLADRVVTLDQGRMVADQPIDEFRRTRLHPEVAVRGPQMARLADLLLAQGAEVRHNGGAGLAVSGLGRTEIGELAYRSGILLHELADRVVEQPAPRAVQLTAASATVAPAVRLLPAAAAWARKETLADRHAAPRPGAPTPSLVRALPGPAGEAGSAAASAPAPTGAGMRGSAGHTGAERPAARACAAAPVPVGQPQAAPTDLIPEPLTGPDH